MSTGSEGPGPSRSLATRAIHGLVSTGGASLFQVFIILALYRFLPVGDMGDFEAALIPVMFFAQLGNFGLSWALVQHKGATDLHFSSAFWANLLWGGLLTGGLVAGAPWIAAVYTPDATPGVDPAAKFLRVFVPLALLIPFASVSHLFRARLLRELDFHPTARAEVISVGCNALAVVVCMQLGYGILSPVIGAVLREGSLLAALWWYTRWWPGLVFSAAALREIFPFALNFTGSRGLNFLNTNLARLFVFPLIGAEAMGYYSFAYRLTLQVLTRLSTVVTQVVFPAFSSIQEDDALLRRGYLKGVQGLALLAGPALMGLFVFAPEVLRLAAKDPALIVLRLLIAAVLLKAINVIAGSVYLAKGKSHYNLYWSMFNLVVLVPVMYWATDYGIEGIAAAVVATSFVFLFIAQHLANRLIGLRFSTFFAHLGRPGLVGLAVLLPLWALRPLLPGPPWAVLAAGTLAGLLLYGAALRFLAADLCRTYWRDIRGKLPG